MYGLNIHLHSFYLNRNLVDTSDKIRVSITTIPEENKEAFVVNGDKTGDVHHFFTVNVSNQTKRIIFVFRKKSLFSNHIIASTIIPFNELPQSENDEKNTELKTIKIYEPFQHLNDNPYAIQNRRVFGEMKIEFKPTEAFPVSSIKDNYNNYSKKISNRYSTYKVTSINNDKSYMSYGYSNENDYQNQNYHQANNQNQFYNQDQNDYQNYSQENYQNQNQNQYQQPVQQQQNQFVNNQYQQQQPVQQQNQFDNNQYQQYQQPVQQQQQMVFVNDLI